MIRNIIFDVGRVLVGYDTLRYMEARGYTEEEQRILRDAMFENPLWLVADRGPIETQELIDGFAANAPGHEELVRDAYRHAEGTIWEFPYAEQWVKELKERGYRLYVLSNYGKDLYERTKEKMPFLPYMDGAVFSHRCHLLKPEREIFQYLCDSYALLPTECVFLDDTAANIEAARQFGMHGILFDGYERAKERLEALLELYEEEDRMGYCAE